MPRIFAIPDIHGRHDLLVRLLDRLKTEFSLDLRSDLMIFLGDMIDRGPDSKKVLDTVRALEKDFAPNVVVLYGNHEEFMLSALAKGRPDSLNGWLMSCNGGRETLRSFQNAEDNPKKDDAQPVPAEYFDWIAGLKRSYEIPGFFFSHAPQLKEHRRDFMNRGKPRTQEELIWTHFDDERGQSEWFKDSQGNVVGVCGHIHRLTHGIFAPRYYEHYLFLDAGAGCSLRAPLVCTEVTTRTPIAVWPERQTPILHPRRNYFHESFCHPEKPEGTPVPDPAAPTV